MLRCVLLAALFAWAGCATNPLVEPRREPGFELFVLGTAQDGGLPHFGCDRPCCAEARRTGRVLFPTALGIVDRRSGGLVLVEATPKVEEQVALLHELVGAEDRGRQPVDSVLTTHAHMGHYLGLAWFGREVASSQRVPVHTSERFAAYLRGHGPWKQLVELQQIELVPFAAREPFEPLPGLRVRAVPVPHRDEFSDTMAFVFEGPRRSVAFVPDVDSWDRAEGVLDELAAADVLYVDGTFYDGRELPDRDLAEIRHPLVVDTMQRLGERTRKHPGTVRFLHCNHTNPLLHDPELVRELEARGFALARPGERIEL